MKIVLDTNCLIHILGRRATHRWLYDAILNGDIALFVSGPILLEYEEVLNRFFDHSTIGKNVVELLNNLPNVTNIEVYFNWQLIEKDPDDDKFVDVAIAANADCIVSDDVHFKVLQQIDFPNVPCFGLDEFAVHFGR